MGIEQEEKIIESETAEIERISAEMYHSAEGAFANSAEVQSLSSVSAEASFLAEYMRLMGLPVPENTTYRLRMHDRLAADGSISGSCKIWSLESGEGSTKPILVVEDTQVDTESRLVLQPGKPA